MATGAAEAPAELPAAGWQHGHAAAPPPPPSQQQAQQAQQASYLEYLRTCARQGRAPADEVVEMARSQQPAGGGALAASTLSLQIRQLEEQLGVAPTHAVPPPPPIPMPIAAA